MPGRPRRTALVVTGLAVLATLSAPATAGATISAASSSVIGRRLLGYSVRHHPIVAYQLGDPRARRVAVILGQMHGDEHAGVRLVRSILHGRRRVAGVDLWVIPSMNPDGNAADTRTNAHGVDLNRNWPVHWTRLAGRYNSGRRPLSEPETRAMYRFLRSVRARYVVSIHQPRAGVDTTDGGRVDPAFRNRLARNLGLAAKPFRCWSSCHGNLTRWYTAHHYGAAVTVEFGAHPSVRYLTGRARRGVVAAIGGRFVR